MGLTFAILFFFGLLLVWVLLPFLPGLNEIQRKTDAMPLPIAHDSEVDIRYLARRFRAFIRIPLTPILDECRAKRRNEQGTLEDGTEYLAIGEDGDLIRFGRGVPPQPCTSMLLSSNFLRLPPKSVFAQDLYAAEWIEGGADNVYRAILADGSISLGERSTSLRWIHAGGMFRTAPGCRLLGRVSADQGMKLASSCRFERLHAPRIEFGNPVEMTLSPAEYRPVKSSQLSNLVEDKAGRWLIHGGLKLGAGKEVHADLVVTGRVEIGMGTRIFGSIKSHKDMVLAQGVTVTGSLVSRCNLLLDKGCRVDGPVIAERSITIEAGCILGTPERMTTVSAKQIRIAPGVVCHGTVRAHEGGMLSGIERVQSLSEREPRFAQPAPRQVEPDTRIAEGLLPPILRPAADEQAEKVPVAEISAGAPPYEEPSATEAPVGETFVEELPVEDALAEEPPVEDTLVEVVPVEVVPEEPATPRRRMRLPLPLPWEDVKEPLILTPVTVDAGGEAPGPLEDPSRSMGHALTAGHRLHLPGPPPPDEDLTTLVVVRPGSINGSAEDPQGQSPWTEPGQVFSVAGSASSMARRHLPGAPAWGGTQRRPGEVPSLVRRDPGIDP